MNKDRIIALTDGIVAIAATIMVLELKIPKIITLDSLLSQIPILYSYIISFALIYLAWRSHHNAFEKAEIINSKIFILNGIWLFFITLIPFATGLIGHAPRETLSSAIYSIVLILWILTFQILDIEITKINPEAPADEVRDNKARILLFGSYISALIVAFIVPVLTVIIIGLNILIMALYKFITSDKEIYT